MSAPGSAPVLEVGELAALLNQTLEYAYPLVVVRGELNGFRVSRNKWLRFNLQDSEASLPFFGSVYQLPGPLSDGMLLEVSGTPRLHPRFGFSVSVRSIQLAGEGSIKKAAELLKQKLTAEGLFDPARKRHLPYPPASIGLITSKTSAAYADFTKVLGGRFGGMAITLADVAVQGQAAAEQIVRAVQSFGALASPPDVLVLTRGGGAAEDLQVFSDERVVRAVAASRIPTLVAVGHEIDISLAELAADVRASTPSNAAELLVPERHAVLRELHTAERQLKDTIQRQLKAARSELELAFMGLGESALRMMELRQSEITRAERLLAAFSPRAVLMRGYAVLRKGGRVVRSTSALNADDIVDVEMADGHLSAMVKPQKGDSS